MAEGTQIVASDIAKAILETTGDALLCGDFAAFRSVFHVPQTMATMAGPIFMETEDDMRRAFDEMHSYFKGLGVTNLVRQVVVAEYSTPARIASTHTCDLLCNGQYLSDSYPVFSIIERIDGNWKVTKSEYALEATNGQAMALAKADVTNRKAG